MPLRWQWQGGCHPVCPRSGQQAWGRGGGQTRPSRQRCPCEACPRLLCCCPRLLLQGQLHQRQRQRHQLPQRQLLRRLLLPLGWDCWGTPPPGLAWRWQPHPPLHQMAQGLGGAPGLRCQWGQGGAAPAPQQFAMPARLPRQLWQLQQGLAGEGAPLQLGLRRQRMQRPQLQQPQQQRQRQRQLCWAFLRVGHGRRALLGRAPPQPAPAAAAAAAAAARAEASLLGLGRCSHPPLRLRLLPPPPPLSHSSTRQACRACRRPARPPLAPRAPPLPAPAAWALQ